MKLSIIIPAYNEGERISKTLENYALFFKKKPIEFEILVVLNGCKDNTLKVVEKLKKNFREIRYLNFKQAGKGFAVLEGFKNALVKKNDLIGFVDADMATSPEEYYNLIKNIDNYDGIIASRYIKGSIVKPKQPIKRIIASRIFNFIVRSLFIFNYKDTQCGAKLFKRKAAEIISENMGLTEWSFDIDMLYIAKRNNLKVKELATIWQDKKGSRLKLKKASIRMFVSVIRLRLIYSPFKIIVRMYDKLPEFLKVHHKL